MTNYPERVPLFSPLPVQRLAFLHDPIVEEDRAWFAANPDRKYRVRLPGEGEAIGFEPVSGDFWPVVIVHIDDGKIKRAPSRICRELPDEERHARAAYILAAQGKNFLRHSKIITIAKKMSVRGGGRNV